MLKDKDLLDSMTAIEHPDKEDTEEIIGEE
jgi:hypothetical protein